MGDVTPPREDDDSVEKFLYSEELDIKIVLPVFVGMLILALVAVSVLPKIMHEDQRTVTSFFTEERDTETETEIVDEFFGK